ncbi:hypothetical protein [Neorhodopirellula pilleata]|nr:hypothetical protein [Neorhodopirellula pilleata]
MPRLTHPSSLSTTRFMPTDSHDRTSTDSPRTLQPLGQYRWPAMPTDESLRRISWKLWKRYQQTSEDPFIASESLRLANRRRLNKIAAPPACGPVVQELQATFADWADDEDPARWLQLVVMSPCDSNDIVRSWADQEGYRVVSPPPRSALLTSSKEPLVDFNCPEKVLVVPRLERWFLRHHDGLGHVRRLLSEASEARRHCVLGCNSWAWQFLCKAIGANLLLPAGLTFEAFDADRLRAWLLELSSNDETETDWIFRFSSSGEEVFAKNSSSDEANNFFAKLAATSLGIPWVAWHLWRQGLRFGPDDDQHREKFPDETTMWVAAIEEMHLPSADVDVSLLTLQALLIHDGLTSVELDLATPSVDASNILPSLLAADLVERDGDRYYVAPAAYPAVRGKLNDAGFPMDKL